MKEQQRLSIRLDDELSARLEKTAKKLGVDRAVLGRACLEALIEHVEQNGSITLPIKISDPKDTPASGAPTAEVRAARTGSPSTPDSGLALVAETAAEYKPRRGTKPQKA